MKPQIAITFFAILSCLLFTKCNVGTNKSWVNNNIDSQIRSEISGLNHKLLTALTTKDLAGVKQLMSPVVIEKSGNSIDSLVINSGQVINNKEYDILDEYYTKNSSVNITNVLMPVNYNSSSYVLRYLALNKEMYASLLVPKDPSVNVLILAIYGKYDNGWKLNILQVNEYKLFNQTAVDFYNKAVKDYDKGYFIDAANSMFIASKIATPGANYLQYKKNDEMKAFFEKAIRDANSKYKFPVTIQQIKTQPQVFGIEPQVILNGEQKGIFPIIRYKSDINLADTVALKIENKEMQKRIGEVFKGIDQNKSVIVYQAYNQIPDGKTKIRNFGMIQKLK